MLILLLQEAGEASVHSMAHNLNIPATLTAGVLGRPSPRAAAHHLPQTGPETTED